MGDYFEIVQKYVTKFKTPTKYCIEWRINKALFCPTDTPTGELPYLEVGEKQLTQSLTIARYLAREFGESSKSGSV